MFLLSKILYNLGIGLYYRVAGILSIFNPKAKLWYEGRKQEIKKIEGKSIWFHCASLGEFEQARPLLEKLKKDYPKFKIVLTFYSPSGFEIRKNYSEADFVYYLPLDTAKNSKQFIEKINPEMVFFIKYEFWYHFLFQLHEKKISTYLVSGIFREKQIFFKPYGVFFKKMLSYFNHLFVQDLDSVALLKTIGISNASQANDTRFDRVLAIKNQSQDFENIQNFVNGEKCIVLGSSWLEDEKLFAQLENIKDFKLIIAPHNINEKRISEVQNLFKDNVLYSDLNSENAKAKYLIIDNMGMLSSIYKYGQIAYIGGGFGVSIHNILEAAVYGIPVVFGPAHHKMKEAQDLINCGGGFEVNNFDTLKQTFDKLQKATFLTESSQKAGHYVSSNIGGTEKVIDFLKKENKLY